MSKTKPFRKWLKQKHGNTAAENIYSRAQAYDETFYKGSTDALIFFFLLKKFFSFVSLFFANSPASVNILGLAKLYLLIYSL